jgi:hypothetical protein
MFCTHCGGEITGGSVFCKTCGNRVGDAAVATAVAPPPAEEIAASPPAAPVSTGMKIAKTALASFLGLLAFAFITVTLVFIMTRPGNVLKVVEKADFARAMEEAGINEARIEDINSKIGIDLVLDEESLKDFLRRDNVSAEVGKLAEKYISAMSEGNFDYHITSREIINTLKAVAPDIRAEFGYRMTDSDYEFIADDIQENFDLKAFRVSTVLGDANVGTAAPYMAFSVYPLIVAALLFALTVFNIFLLYKKRIRNALLVCSIPLMSAGLLFILAGLLAGPFSGLLRNSGVYNLLQMASGVAAMLLIPGLICLFIGLLSLAGMIVIRKLAERHVFKPSKDFTKAWRLTAIIVNITVPVLCAAFSLLLYANLP